MKNILLVLFFVSSACFGQEKSYVSVPNKAYRFIAGIAKNKLILLEDSAKLYTAKRMLLKGWNMDTAFTKGWLTFLTIKDNSSNWNTAYGWGNWAGHTQAISTITGLQDSITNHYTKSQADNKYQLLSNLVTTTGTSATKYMSQAAVKTYGDSIAGTKQASGSYEVTTNKVTDSKRSTSTTKYYNAVTSNAQIDSIGGLKWNKLDTTSTLETKTYNNSKLALKSPLASPMFTGTLTTSGGTVSINANSNYAMNIGTGTTTGIITIGGTATQTINIGDGSATKTVVVGDNNGAVSGSTQIGGATTINGTLNYGAASGGSPTFSVTITPWVTALTTGLFLIIKMPAANATTTPTLNVNSLGAKTIVKRLSTALATNDFTTNMFCLFVYDGTNMVLINPVVN